MKNIAHDEHSISVKRLYSWLYLVWVDKISCRGLNDLLKCWSGLVAADVCVRDANEIGDVLN